MTTKVVNLGRVRELLPQWETVKAAILAGKTQGFSVTLIDDEGRDTVYIGGVYREDSRKALRAAMQQSAARTLLEDEPPLFQASNL